MERFGTAHITLKNVSSRVTWSLLARLDHVSDLRNDFPRPDFPRNDFFSTSYEVVQKTSIPHYSSHYNAKKASYYVIEIPPSSQSPRYIVLEYYSQCSDQQRPIKYTHRHTHIHTHMKAQNPQKKETSQDDNLVHLLCVFTIYGKVKKNN